MEDLLVNTKIIHLDSFREKSARGGANVNSVSECGPSLDNLSFWELDNIACIKKYWTYLKGFDAFNHTHNSIGLINKNGINGKPHKEHMNGLAPCDNQSLLFLKAVSA